MWEAKWKKSVSGKLARKLYTIFFSSFLMSCTTGIKGNSFTDENGMIGKWVLQRESSAADALNECNFGDDLRYVCYSYPSKNSGSDVTIDYSGRFKIENHTLHLYHEKDQILNIDERLMQSFKIISVDDTALVLMGQQKKQVYKRANQ